MTMTTMTTMTTATMTTATMTTTMTVTTTMTMTTTTTTTSVTTTTTSATTTTMSVTFLNMCNFSTNHRILKIQKSKYIKILPGIQILAVTIILRWTNVPKDQKN